MEVHGAGGGIEGSQSYKGYWNEAVKSGSTLIPIGEATNFAIEADENTTEIFLTIWKENEEGDWETVHQSHPLKSDRGVIIKKNWAIALAEKGQVWRDEEFGLKHGITKSDFDEL